MSSQWHLGYVDLIQKAIYHDYEGPCELYYYEQRLQKIDKAIEFINDRDQEAAAAKFKKARAKLKEAEVEPAHLGRGKRKRDRW